MRRGSFLLAMAATPAADSQCAGSRPVASGCCDHEAAHDTVSGAAAARSLELIGDLLDAGLDAGFILVAAGSAGNADRADHLLADHDRQRAARGGKPVRYCAPICGFFFSRSSISPDGMRNVRAVKAFLKLFSMVCGPVPSPRIWTSTSPLRPTTVADTR